MEMLEEKIVKANEDLKKLKEKVQKKKKEIERLELQKRELENRKRISENEKIISSLEHRLGQKLTPDIVEQIVDQIEKPEIKMEEEKHEDSRCF